MTSLKFLVFAYLVALSSANAVSSSSLDFNKFSRQIGGTSLQPWWSDFKANAAKNGGVLVYNGSEQPLSELKYLARGIGSVAAKVVPILLVIAALKFPGQFQEAIATIIGIASALSRIIQHRYPSLAVLLVVIILAIAKILLCVNGGQLSGIKGGGGGINICDSDFGKEYGLEQHPGKYDSPEDVINHFKLGNINDQIKKAVDHASGGKGSSALPTSVAIIVKSLLHLAPLFAPGHVWSIQDLTVAVSAVTTILGVVGNGLSVGYGSDLVGAVTDYLTPVFKKQGIDLSGFEEEIKDRISKTDQFGFGGALNCGEKNSNANVANANGLGGALKALEVGSNAIRLGGVLKALEGGSNANELGSALKKLGGNVIVAKALGGILTEIGKGTDGKVKDCSEIDSSDEDHGKGNELGGALKKLGGTVIVAKALGGILSEIKKGTDGKGKDSSEIDSSDEDHRKGKELVSALKKLGGAVIVAKGLGGVLSEIGKGTDGKGKDCSEIDSSDEDHRKGNELGGALKKLGGTVIVAKGLGGILSEIEKGTDGKGKDCSEIDSSDEDHRKVNELGGALKKLGGTVIVAKGLGGILSEIEKGTDGKGKDCSEIDSSDEDHKKGNGLGGALKKLGGNVIVAKALGGILAGIGKGVEGTDGKGKDSIK